MRCAVGYRSATSETGHEGAAGYRLVASGSGIRTVHRPSRQHIFEEADRWLHPGNPTATPQRNAVQLSVQRRPETLPQTYDEFMQLSDSDDEQPQPTGQQKSARTSHQAFQLLYAAPAGTAEQPLAAAPSLASVPQPAEVPMQRRAGQSLRQSNSASQTSLAPTSSTAGPGDGAHPRAVEIGGITEMLAQMALSDWSRSTVEIASSQAQEHKQMLEAEVRSLKQQLDDALRESQNNRLMLDVVQEERWEIDRRCREAMTSLDTRTCERIVLEQRLESMKAQLESVTHEKETLRTSSGNERDQCVICMDATPCYAVVPCGHLALCESCMARRPECCPVCRTQASTLLRVYRP